MTNAVIDSLMAHRSIRKFKPQPVEPEVLDAILQAGIRAPTASNLQQYALVVVDDLEKRKALGVAHAPVAIIALADQYRVKRWCEVNDSPPVCNTTAHHLFIAFCDAMIVLHNVVVAAESLGLGACYIGRIQEADIQTILDAPEYAFPAGMVCLGYPDESPPLKTRLPLEAVVHRNAYHRPTDAEIREFYRERDAEWETMSAERKAQLAAQNVHNIAQAVAVRNYAQDVVAGRAEGILRNLKRAKFALGEASH